MASQTETEKVRFRYWNGFKYYLAGSGSDLSVGTPRAKQNHWIKIGPSPMFRRGASHLAVSALVNPREIRANFVLQDRDSLPLFEALRGQRGTLEDEMGVALVFDRREKNEQVGRIYVACAADFRDRPDWPNQFAWLRDMLLELRSAFHPRAE